MNFYQCIISLCFINPVRPLLFPRPIPVCIVYKTATLFHMNYLSKCYIQGSDLAGETAAALAVTSMIFSQVNATYSAICLSHAKNLYTFAKQYQGLYSSSISQAGDFYRYIFKKSHQHLFQTAENCFDGSKQKNCHKI